MLYLTHISMDFQMLRLRLATTPLQERGLFVTSLPGHVMLLLIRRELNMLGGERLDVWGLNEGAVESLDLLFRYPLFEATGTVGHPLRNWGLLLLGTHLLGALLPLLIILTTVRGVPRTTFIVVVMMMVMVILEGDLLILELNDYRLIYNYGCRIRRSCMPLLLVVAGEGSRFARSPRLLLGGCGGGAWRKDCFVKDLVDVLKKA